MDVTPNVIHQKTSSDQGRRRMTERHLWVRRGCSGPLEIVTFGARSRRRGRTRPPASGGAARGPDRQPPGRRGPRRRQPGGLVARHRRPPIRKGRLGRPVEFGYKAQVTDNAQGIVLDHVVELGNPADAPMLPEAITRVTKLFGKVPKAVTADRGYGEPKVEGELESLGVKYVAIPRKGRLGPQRQQIEFSPRFRKLVKWRTGSEGRIAHLKRSWGWERTVLDGIDGGRIWCGWGVLAHNVTKISVLIKEYGTRNGSTSTGRPKATGSPCSHPPPPTKFAA